jgi:ribonuclease P protein component
MGQATATFAAPVFKNNPAGLGAHAFHKAVFTAALTFLGLISLFWHDLYHTINPYPPSTIRYKLLIMISRVHRFHGYNSLRHVYSGGAVVRGPAFAVKFLHNPRRQTYRVAVVVSRKVHKSAVARNRMRRRLYESVRELEADITRSFDIVITVLQDKLLEMPPKELRAQLKKQFKQAGIIS